MAKSQSLWIGLSVVLPVLFAGLYQLALYRQSTILGVFREVGRTILDDPAHIIVIQDTVHCEDVHYHEQSHTLFTACEDALKTRFSWFPPLARFDDPNVGLSGRGSIHVINPDTKVSQRLKFTGFDGPFSTHGIDVFDDPASKTAVYILAVNHVPNSECAKLKREQAEQAEIDSKCPKSDSRIEIFHHVLGSNSARHIRTVQHPLIKTPNDVLALSPTSFLVTNDHYYTHGGMREVEDLYAGAKWTDIIHVECEESAAGACKAAAAHTGLHNNNGLGRGATADELLIGCAINGGLHFGRLPKAYGDKIELFDFVRYGSTIDNPTYFRDPYANASRDASGYVEAGLTRGIDLAKTSGDPEGKEGVMVWLAKRKGPSSKSENQAAAGKWETHLLFEDDGERIRTASAAVLVAIDPKLENGQRKAWLFVTGFISESMIAVKVDLPL